MEYVNFFPLIDYYKHSIIVQLLMKKYYNIIFCWHILGPRAIFFIVIKKTTTNIKITNRENKTTLERNWKIPTYPVFVIKCSQFLLGSIKYGQQEVAHFKVSIVLF